MTQEDAIVIGLDAGTSVIKAVAYSLAGDQLATGTVRNETVAGPGGAAEQDMDAVWGRCAESLRRLAMGLPGLAGRVSAVGVTGQGDGTWPIDAHCRPAGHAMLWLDGRAAEIVAEMRGRGDDHAIFRRTGTVINSSLQSMQLAWAARTGQAWLERSARLLHCKDWLYFNLTGIVATDATEAVNSFGSLAAGRYDDDVIGLLGVKSWRGLLPEILSGLPEPQPLTPQAASATGLPQGTPVVLAPPDYVATAVGMGLLDPSRRQGCSILGSAGVHMMVDADPRPILAGEPCGYCVLMPKHGVHLRMISHLTASLTVDWLADNLAAFVRSAGGADIDRMRVIELLDAGALEAPPCGAFFHPFLSEAGERAPFVEPLARAQFLGLSSSTGFDVLMRSVLEGLGFAARDCYERMVAPPAEVVLSGGVSKSGVMRTILASTLGVPVRLLRQPEAGAMGASLVAATAQGHFSDLDQGAERWLARGGAELTRPEPGLMALYQGGYDVYRSSYEATRPFWAAHEALRARREKGPAGIHAPESTK